MDLEELNFPQKSVSHLICPPRYIMTFSRVNFDSETQETVCNKHTFLLLSCLAFKTKLATKVFDDHKLYHM